METTRWIHFYPRRGRFSALLGHPMAHSIGTRCRVIGKGTQTERFLVKACDIESGYLAWVSPEDVTVLNRELARALPPRRRELYRPCRTRGCALEYPKPLGGELMQTLKERYRPCSLADVIGQPVARQLAEIVRNPRPACIPLEGPTGCGKSTCALGVRQRHGLPARERLAGIRLHGGRRRVQCR